MEGVLLLLFVVALYSLIGFMSTKPFQTWCWFFIKTDHEFTNALGMILAVFWPLGWPLIVVVGLYYAGHVFCELLLKNLKVIWASVEVIASRFKKPEQGDQ
jgi:hypothetical protein